MRQLVQSFNGHVELTDAGTRRARDVVRRHRLAERLFKDTFAVEDSEAHNQACKFEHIISPELDQRICTFLGHPKTCPHGNPFPPASAAEKNPVDATVVRRGVPSGRPCTMSATPQPRSVFCLPRFKL